ncbi:MAG: hypothetical protein KDA89_00080 [Planctomycetaceae bacterium]|nr:hypothetical protein [Planctomycetaceae bacterium]
MAKKHTAATPASPATEFEHPLAEHVERLANELQLTRQVLDEIRTDLQWAIQNCLQRNCSNDNSNGQPDSAKATPVEPSTLNLLPTFDEGDAVVLKHNGEEFFGEVTAINDAENLAEVLLIPSNATITVTQDELSRIDPDTLRRLCSEPATCITPDPAPASQGGSACNPVSPGQLF